MLSPRKDTPMPPIDEQEATQRLAALRNALAKAVRSAACTPVLGQLPTEHVTAMRRRIAAELRAAGTARGRWEKANGHLLAAETLILLLVEMTEQRRGGPFAEFLCHTDIIATQGFELARDRARVLGLLAVVDDPPRLSPRCLLDSTYSPVAFGAGTSPVPAGSEDVRMASHAVVAAEYQVAPAGERPDPDADAKRIAALRAAVHRLGAALQCPEGFPFQVVRMPHRFVEQPQQASILLHEVGHFISWELGLGKKVRARLGALPLEKARLENWERWTDEIIADLYGLVLGGFGFVHALASLVGPLPRSAIETEHPGAATRLVLLSVAADEIGVEARFGTRVDRVRHECRIEGEAPYEEDAPEVLRCMLETPIGGVVLRDLLTLPTGGSRWIRLPGDLLLNQIEREVRVEDAVAQFRARASALLPPAAQDLPTWHEFYRERVQQLAPTLVLPGSLRKVPPAVLGIGHDAMDFVGATQGQLAKMLSLAFDLRDREPWERIAVYFLADRELRWVASRTMDHAALYDEKLEAIKQLTDGYARGWAKRMEIREFRWPTLFASFWWRGGVLQRVHESGRVWGREVRDSPGTDYRRVEGAPNRELNELQAGLAWLRRKGHSTVLWRARRARAPK
ncbi:MAG: hypothetical protein ABIO70_05745 [Pseudomonadota bacterium]